MTTTGWILWFSILGLGCVLMIVGASIESRRMKRKQDEREREERQR